jgi:hypothetical protein
MVVERQWLFPNATGCVAFVVAMFWWCCLLTNQSVIVTASSSSLMRPTLVRAVSGNNHHFLSAGESARFSPITTRAVAAKLNRKKNSVSNASRAANVVNRMSDVTRGSLLKGACPSLCVCQGLSVDCSSRALKNIPNNIPTNVVKL